MRRIGSVEAKLFTKLANPSLLWRFATLDLAGTNTVVGGAVVEAGSFSDVELIPIIATSAIPGGKVTASAVEAVEGRIAAGLRANPPDAVVLDLHGAMVTEVSDENWSPELGRKDTL